jgi:hypothetical protein
VVPYGLITLLIVGATTGVVLTNTAGTTTTSSSTTTSTTTTTPPERPQPGWTVASSSSRGVMVDYRNVVVGAVTFRALRLHARTTLLRWHVGSIDPNLWSRAPVDAGPAIDWPSEGLAGVVALFNGGFKQSAAAGGAVVDGLRLVPLTRGRMTIGIDTGGHWAMGVWGSTAFPPKGFHPISDRQNLGPLVLNGVLTPAAAPALWREWGDPLGGNPLEPRTGLGVDRRGNLIYVATMGRVLQNQLGQALISAGAVTAMQLDINPFWPILGASLHPVHANGGLFPVQLPLSEHSPTVYEGGWQRDFFVALAEPNRWTCNWASRGLSGPPGTIRPQPLSLVGKGCRTTTSTTTTSTTTVTSTTSSTTTTQPKS